MDQDKKDGMGRFAPPQAEVADVASDGLELGGRGARLGAALIDGAIQLGLFWIIGRLTGLNIFDPAMGQASMRMVWAMLAGAGLFLLLQGWLLVTRGQTIGKLLLGMRIVRNDGSRASAGRLLGMRYGIGFVLSAIPVAGSLYALVDSLLIFRGSRKCLHDNIADTIVVKA
jgi:uncharacterized RDD family membrane protein YckC